MSEDEGILSMKSLPLKEVADKAVLQRGKHRNWYEFGIRWVDGEIADDVLVVETDGYFESSGPIEYEGNSYSLQFGEDLLEDALESWSHFSSSKVNAVTALRYMIEFDAAFVPDDLRVGGKWVWGGMRGRPEKRDPPDFCEAWDIA